MMRVCHLNTCPVGVATQDPSCGSVSPGKPEFVEKFFRFVAEDVREIMAQLGFRTIDEMIGRVDNIDVSPAVDHWKAAASTCRRSSTSPWFRRPSRNGACARRITACDKALDNELVRRCEPMRCARRKPVEFSMPIRNVNRTVGTILGSEVTRAYRRERVCPTARSRFISRDRRGRASARSCRAG